EGLVARAAQHDAAQRVVGGELAHHLAEPAPHRFVERVQPLRLVERDGRDCAVTAGKDGIAHQLIQAIGPRLIHGTYVTRSVTRASTAVNGQPTRKTSQNESLAIAAVVKSTVATGGVCWPTPRLIVTMMPKWIGSTPIWRTSGSTMGTMRMIAAAECRNMPATKKKRLRNSRIRILLLVVS